MTGIFVPFKTGTTACQTCFCYNISRFSYTKFYFKCVFDCRTVGQSNCFCGISTYYRTLAGGSFIGHFIIPGVACIYRKPVQCSNRRSRSRHSSGGICPGNAISCIIVSQIGIQHRLCHCLETELARIVCYRFRRQRIYRYIYDYIFGCVFTLVASSLGYIVSFW